MVAMMNTPGIEILPGVEWVSQMLGPAITYRLCMGDKHVGEVTHFTETADAPWRTQIGLGQTAVYGSGDTAAASIQDAFVDGMTALKAFIHASTEIFDTHGTNLIASFNNLELKGKNYK